MRRSAYDPLEPWMDEYHGITNEEEPATVKRQITFEGATYTLKPKAVETDFPQDGDRLKQLIWLNQNTYAKGYQMPRVQIGGARLAGSRRED